MSNKNNQKSAQNTQTQTPKSHRLGAMVQVDSTYAKSAGSSDEEKAKLLGGTIDVSKILARACVEGRFAALSLSESKATGSLTDLVSLPVENGVKVSVRVTLIKSGFEGARGVIATATGIDPTKLGCDATEAVGLACKAGLFSALKTRASQKGNVTSTAAVRDVKVVLKAVEPRTKAETEEEKKQFLLSQLA